MRKLLTLSIAAILLTGCASSEVFNQTAAEQIKQKLPEPYVEKAKPLFKEVKREDVKNVDLVLENAPFMPVLEKMVDKMGWSLKVLSDVNRKATIIMTVKNVSLLESVKELAFSAGYVPVFDYDEKKVYLSSVATYSFNVPVSLLSDDETSIKVGGNPTQLSGGGASQTKGIDSQFTVSNKYSGAGKEFLSQLRDTAGADATVSVIRETGEISVRAGATALSRVHRYINAKARNAMKVVRVDGAMIMVELTGDFVNGIQWEKIVPSTQLDKISSATELSSTNLDISEILSSIEKKAKVHVLARPIVYMANNTSAIIFYGMQKPYVGSYGASDGINLSYLIDGFSLSVRSSVIQNSDLVMFDILPVVTSVSNSSSFDIGNDMTLEGKNQKVSGFYSRLIASSGETVILSSGHRIDNQQNNNVNTMFNYQDGDPGKVPVFLFVPTVIGAPEDYDSLVWQSI
jgi:type II secretory pathway component GspD/PulD (secretin)